jgi:thiamine-monophosphate kinase
MYSGTPNSEMSLLKQVAGLFARHSMQANQLLEADAEIIDVKDNDFTYLVLKVDGIHEEISEGLYDDPFLIGWMAVTVTLSDLAAVGAIPLGVLLSLRLPVEKVGHWLTGFQKGINEACAVYDVCILGGDTNFDASVSVTTTGVATIDNGRPLMRKPIVVGDLLYATNKLGVGNAFAYTRYFDRSINVTYQPVARIKESALIRQFATACIDTSDGLFPALSILSELNKIGIRLTTPLQNILEDKVLHAYDHSGIPAWIFLAGPHGEYELIFSIPLGMKDEVEKCYSTGYRKPVLLGEVIEEPLLHFSSEDLQVRCDPALVANLFSEVKGDIPLYFETLMKQHQLWCAK